MSRMLPQPSRADLDLATVLSALADPVRLKLVQTLSHRKEPSTCHRSAYDVDVGAPTLSHHWRVLRESGLTSTVTEGRNRWVELRFADLDARFPGLIGAVLFDGAAADGSTAARS